MSTGRVKVNKFLLAIVGLFGATLLMSTASLAQDASVSAIPKTTYTNLDMSGTWNTPRGISSGGYTATVSSLTQVIDSTAADPTPANQTEALAKTVPDSQAIRAKLTIDADWQNKPVRVGL